MSQTVSAPRIARGVFNSFAAHVLSLGIVFAGLAFLARILSAEEIGLFMMAAAITGLLEVTRDFGLGPAIIYHAARSNDPEAILSTGFYLSLVVGVLITVLLLALAPAAGAFFYEERVTSFLQVLAWYFLISSVAVIPDTILRQRLQFGRRLWAQITAPAARYGVAIVLAVAGYGAWSLVVGQLVGAVLSTLLCLLLAGWRPMLQVQSDLIGRLLTYGGQGTIVNVLAAVILNADYAFVGRFLGGAELGVYSLAFRLPDSILVSAAWVLSNVLLPVYVSASHAPDGLERAFARALRLHAILLVPASAGICLLAPWLVPVLFGDRWQAGIPVLQLLTVSCFVRAMTFSAGAVFQAAGRPSLLVAAQVAWACAMVPATYVAAQVSIIAVGGIQIIAAVVYALVTIVLLRRVLIMTRHTLWSVFGPCSIASGVMVTLLLGVLTVTDGAPSIVVLATSTIIGAATYILVLGKLDPTLLDEVKSLLRPRQDTLAAPTNP